MSFNNKESELNEIIRVLHKKDESGMEERLARVVLFLHKELMELKSSGQDKVNQSIAEIKQDIRSLESDVHRVEMRTQGMDRAR